MTKRREFLWGPARRNVVASFRNWKQARRAIGTLESHGFDTAAIRVEKDGAAAGSVDVAAGSDDPIKVDLAEEALRDLGPIEVRRVDEHGEPI